MASSPVVAQQTVVVQIENQGDSFVAAIDARNGQTRWQIARPRRANWSSPVITQTRTGESMVLVKSGDGLDAHDLRSGLHRWSYRIDADGIPSIATLPGTIFLPAGGLTVLDLASDGTAPRVRWSNNRVNPGPTSPVVADDRVYGINSAGVLTCADQADGKVLWQLRLQGTFWATPVLLGDHLYCFNDAGLAQVVRLGDKGHVVATHPLGETIQGSPAVADGALYVRSDQSLWKIATTR
jgi:outer membrane protein assembly factor BamB